MANKEKKHPQNVPGIWYCTSSSDDSGEACIACGLCIAAAPDIFGEDENGEAYVIKQPETPSEEELAKEQKDACPVNAIGSDG